MKPWMRTALLGALGHAAIGLVVMYCGYALGATLFGRPGLALGRTLATSSLPTALGVCRMALDESHVARCLEAIGTSTSIDARTADILRLHVHAVAAEKLGAAAHAEQAMALCRSLAWPACDADSVGAMGGRGQ
jgi:hypothetical protein